ncbi:TPA: DUF454 family protein [Neisseria subflava]
MIRHLLIFCGALSLVLGIIGIFLPFLPTTPFILLTATLLGTGFAALSQLALSSPLFRPHYTKLGKQRRRAAQGKVLRYRYDDLFLPVDVLAVSGTLVDWCHIVNLLQLRGCVDVAAAGSINKTGRHCCLPVFYFHTQFIH